MNALRSEEVFRQIDRLFADGTVAGYSDADLLARFLERRDETAFAALVERHGAMVVGVCRAVLKDPHEAEDAAQAAFLILARKAASIRGRDALGGWLHRVAVRISVQMSVEQARRKAREREAGETVAARLAARDTDDELRPLIHAEIDRLPEHLRFPVVLCDLEGLTREQAAARLRWSEGTVRGRLAKARSVLKDRLTRRGFAPTAGLLTAALANETAAAAIPESLAKTITGRCLSGTLAGTSAGAVAVVSRSLALTRLRILAPLLFLPVAAAGSSAAWLAWLGPEDPKPSAVPPNRGVANEAPVNPRGKPDSPARAAQPEPPRSDRKAAAAEEVELTYHGRVVDSKGKGIANAKVFLSTSAPQSPHAATTGTDGTFRFTARGNEQIRTAARVLVDAEGFALGTASQDYTLSHFPTTDPPDAERELTISLVEDLPIQGLLIDLEGRPVVGAAVSVPFLYAPPERDLTRWLNAVKAGESRADDLKFTYLGRVYLHDHRPRPSVATDEHGRFTLRGLGRERLANVEITAPTIRPLSVQIITRAVEPLRTLKDPRFPQFGTTTFYGTSPRLTAVPSRPIEGFVRDQSTGTPIAGARIMSAKLADRNVWNDKTLDTKTDASGHYRLLGAPPGVGNVLVVGGPPEGAYLPVQVDVANPPGLEPVRLDVRLLPGIPIEGRVDDKRTSKRIIGSVTYHAAKSNPNLTAVPGFQAHMVSDGLFLSAEIAKDGRFRVIGLPGPGALVVNVRDGAYAGISKADFSYAPGVSFFYQLLQKVEIPAQAATFRQDLLLDSGPTIDGVVSDPDGRALPGVRVYGLTNLGGWQTLAGSDFRVLALRNSDSTKNTPSTNSRSLVFLHPERKLAGWIDLRGNETALVRVMLQPSASVVARIVNGDSFPQADVTLKVHAKRPRLGNGEIEHDPERVRTDRDGRFTIEGFAPGLPYELDVQAPPRKRATRRIEIAPARPGETRDLGNVTVEYRDE